MTGEGYGSGVPEPHGVRLALIGAGRWGANLMRTLSSLEGVDLAYVCTLGSRPAELPDGCELMFDWRLLLGESDLAGVLIATPAAVHVEQAAEFLARGLPVFLEKPMATTIADARTLDEVSRRRGAALVVDHTYLFNPAFRRLKQRFRELEPGPAELSVRLGNRGPLRPDLSVLWDWGPHAVAIALDLLGEVPDSVDCRVDASTGPSETVSVFCTFKSGSSCQLVIGNSFRERTAEVEVESRLQRLRFRDVEPVGVWESLPGDTVWRSLSFLPAQPLTVALGEFVQIIAGRRQAEPGARMGLAVVSVLARCQGLLPGTLPEGGALEV